MPEPMTDRALVEMALEMRKAQAAYFRDKSRTSLDRAKGLERDFDFAARKHLSGQPTQSNLFDGGRNNG